MSKEIFLLKKMRDYKFLLILNKFIENFKENIFRIRLLVGSYKEGRRRPRATFKLTRVGLKQRKVS